ncbi:MAG: restriction endonuclease subunit S [Bacilli bacterium]
MKPKLRFLNFNNDYEIKEISDITYNVSSGKISKQLEDGEYNVYGSMGIIGKSNFYDYTGEKVLVARVGANAGSVNKINEKCCISDNTLVLEPKNILNDYLYYSLSHYDPKKLIFGSGQPLVTGGQLKKIKLGVPSKEEQVKVSNFLSLLDKKIELQTKKIEDLKLFKLCLNTKLFKGLKDTKLKAICECNSSSISLSDIENDYGIYPIYGANGEIKKIKDYQYDREYLAIIKDGAGVGKTFVCNKNSSIIATLNALISNDIPIYYFNELLKQIKFNKYIVGSGIPHIYFKDYSNEKLHIHNQKDRSKINELFKNINIKTELEEQKLVILIKIKKGLMQKMFV